MKTADIVRRVEQRLGLPGVVRSLAERLAPTDLQSLLLAVYRQRSGKRRPADVLRDYESNRFVGPSRASPAALRAVEAALRDGLPEGIEELELSPVCPLGSSAVIAGLSQDWAVPTIRHTEVVSDGTNVLALECALRRRALLRATPRSTKAVLLCASQRLLRPQFYDQPNMLAHFRLFHVCSAGRDVGNLSFETATILTHATAYLGAVQTVMPQLRLEFLLTDFHAHDRYSHLEQRLLDPLRATFPAVGVMVHRARETGRGYYRDLCFHINAHTPSGQVLQLSDGGVVDWTQKLLGDRKERLVISAISSERLATLSTGR